MSEDSSGEHLTRQEMAKRNKRTAVVFMIVIAIVAGLSSISLYIKQQL